MANGVDSWELPGILSFSLILAAFKLQFQSEPDYLHPLDNKLYRAFDFLQTYDRVCGRLSTKSFKKRRPVLRRNGACGAWCL